MSFLVAVDSIGLIAVKNSSSVAAYILLNVDEPSTAK
jgi:hypothetical protein